MNRDVHSRHVFQSKIIDISRRKNLEKIWQLNYLKVSNLNKDLQDDTNSYDG